MVTITTFSFVSDLLGIDLNFDNGSGNTCTSLWMYIGSDYLTPAYIDLTSLVGATQVVDLTGVNKITPADLGLDASTPLSGIFTVYIVASDAATKESAIMSDYLLSLCLANKTIQQNQDEDLNETSYLYMLIQGTKTYLSEDQVEQALGAYERAASICEACSDCYETDILPCGEGTGCWIIDGVYTVKR